MMMGVYSCSLLLVFDGIKRGSSIPCGLPPVAMSDHRRLASISWQCPRYWTGFAPAYGSKGFPLGANGAGSGPRGGNSAISIGSIRGNAGTASRREIEPISDPAIWAEPVKMKQPSTSSSPRRAERWPASIDMPKQATAMVINITVNGPAKMPIIQSAAGSITDITELSFYSDGYAWLINNQRPSTVNDPPVMFPAVV